MGIINDFRGNYYDLITIEKFSQKLNQLIKDKGITKEDLKKATGVSSINTVEKWLEGHNRPNYDNFKKILNEFDISYYTFLPINERDKFVIEYMEEYIEKYQQTMKKKSIEEFNEIAQEYTKEVENMKKEIKDMKQSLNSYDEIKKDYKQELARTKEDIFQSLGLDLNKYFEGYKLRNNFYTEVVGVFDKHITFDKLLNLDKEKELKFTLKKDKNNEKHNKAIYVFNKDLQEPVGYLNYNLANLLYPKIEELKITDYSILKDINYKTESINAPLSELYNDKYNNNRHLKIKLEFISKKDKGIINKLIKKLKKPNENYKQKLLNLKEKNKELKEQNRKLKKTIKRLDKEKNNDNSMEEKHISDIEL